MKTALKKSLLPGSTLFENMGFTYMGPVDGHDVIQLTRMLREAKDLRCPVLLHVHTVKGQGYGPGRGGSRPVPWHRTLRCPYRQRQARRTQFFLRVR